MFTYVHQLRWQPPGPPAIRSSSHLLDEDSDGSGCTARSGYSGISRASSFVPLANQRPPAPPVTAGAAGKGWYSNAMNIHEPSPKSQVTSFIGGMGTMLILILRICLFTQNRNKNNWPVTFLKPILKQCLLAVPWGLWKHLQANNSVNRLVSRWSIWLQ